jgi:HSP90 family molecular chaperone
MIDPIDDWVTQSLQEYKGHTLQDAKHAQISSNKDAKEVTAEKKEQDKINQDNKDFLAFSKEAIGKERIDSIALVTTLTDSVAVLLPKE